MIGSEEKVQIFNEMEKHLMQDEKPSVYFQRLSNLPWFTEPPFNMLADLKKTKQNPAFHPEGHVWNHTMLVVDEAAIRAKAVTPEALCGQRFYMTSANPARPESGKAKLPHTIMTSWARR